MNDMDFDLIFAPYLLRRTMIIDELMNDRYVRGFWSETLFPLFKDMVRYGADTFMPKGKAGEYADMAVDAAGVALGTIAPELLPIIQALKNTIKPYAESTSEMLA